MKKTTITLLIGLSCFGSIAQIIVPSNGAYITYATNGFAYYDIYEGGNEIQRNRATGETTNIVVSTNYTGTIQIGTNFYTVKDLQNGILIVMQTNTRSAFQFIPMLYLPQDITPLKTKGSELDLWTDSTGKSGITFKHFWP